MTATAHALIGTVIAAKIPNPYIAIPLAIASHILADLTPHWDSGTNSKSKTKDRLRKEATADVLIGFASSYLLIAGVFPETNLLYAFFMILVSQSLDWVTAPYYFFNIKVPGIYWLYRFQKITNTRLNAPWGVITQVTVILILILLGKFF